MTENEEQGKSQVSTEPAAEQVEQDAGQPSNEPNSRAKRSTTALARRGGSPGTPAGKLRSKFNARKHCIFSAVVVLPGESRSDYQALIDGLRNSLQPVGEMEELLVEDLATNRWRKRRLFIAEGAEIRKSQQSPLWNQEVQEVYKAERIAAANEQTRAKEGPNQFFPKLEGLIWHWENPLVLDRCLIDLRTMRWMVPKYGFNFKPLWDMLTKLYGSAGTNRLYPTLLDAFVTYANLAEIAENKPQTKVPLGSPGDYKEVFLECLEGEISRLEGLNQILAERKKCRVEIETLRHSVPDAQALDRLLRYETTLERSFDRTLGQLERLQRMRLGQPVSPPVKLEVSRN